MKLADIFKTKKNATVEEIDSQLQNVATERLTISDRKNALIEIIAAMWGQPEAEQAETEHSRLDARLKALSIVESNLTTERRAAEVRATLAGYQERVKAAQQTRNELIALEQGDDGLLAIEKRYHHMLAESKRLRYSLRGQMTNLVEEHNGQPEDIRAGIERINATVRDLFDVTYGYTHEEAMNMKEIYDALH